MANLNEISKSLAKRYIAKAVQSASDKSRGIGYDVISGKKVDNHRYKKIAKREAGISKAAERHDPDFYRKNLYKKPTNEENINEISKNVLKSYKDKANNELTKKNYHGEWDSRKVHNRYKGIDKATKKLTNEEKDRSYHDLVAAFRAKGGAVKKVESGKKALGNISAKQWYKIHTTPGKIKSKEEAKAVLGKEKVRNEEINIQELSKNLLTRYMNKADAQHEFTKKAVGGSLLPKPIRHGLLNKSLNRFMRARDAEDKIKGSVTKKIHATEETNIQELSQDLIGRYKKRAMESGKIAGHNLKQHDDLSQVLKNPESKKAHGKHASDYAKILNKRTKGMMMAKNKTVKEENIQEISVKKLGRYLTKNQEDRSRLHKKFRSENPDAVRDKYIQAMKTNPDLKKSIKREKGFNMALAKATKTGEWAGIKPKVKATNEGSHREYHVFSFDDNNTPQSGVISNQSRKHALKMAKGSNKGSDLKKHILTKSKRDYKGDVMHLKQRDVSHKVNEEQKEMKNPILEVVKNIRLKKFNEMRDITVDVLGEMAVTRLEQIKENIAKNLFIDEGKSFKYDPDDSGSDYKFKTLKRKQVQKSGEKREKEVSKNQPNDNVNEDEVNEISSEKVKRYIKKASIDAPEHHRAADFFGGLRKKAKPGGDFEKSTSKAFLKCSIKADNRDTGIETGFKKLQGKARVKATD